MMKLSCKDIDSNSNCDFTATGDTATEVVDEMMDHIQIDHADKMKSMDSLDIMNMMKSKVHSQKGVT